MLMLLLAGIIVDQFGRKWVLFLMAIGTSLSLIFVPVVAPNKWGYISLVLLENLFALPLAYNPLIQDYVAQESIGRAVAVN